MKKTVSLMLITVLLVSVSLIAGCNLTNNKPTNTSPEPKLTEHEVVLYFSDDQAMSLLPEKRTIKIESPVNTETLAQEIVKQLIAGPESENLNPTLPAETKLLSAEIKDHIAYLDFSEEIRTNHIGGSTGETMTIMSIVNSLTELEDIDKVQFLIAGEKQDSLVGHWYIGEPIERDEEVLHE